MTEFYSNLQFDRVLHNQRNDLIPDLNNHDLRVSKQMFYKIEQLFYLGYKYVLFIDVIIF